jgi:putative hydrolase of the HAD superfamily
VDLDNTLYDFSTVQEAACRAVIRVIGAGDYKSLIRAFLFSTHGVESQEAIREYLYEVGIFDEAVFTIVCNEYAQKKAEILVPFPGVIESINRIHKSGIKIGAITNASSHHARNRITQLGLQALIPVLVSPDVCGLRKPDPTMFQKAADEMDLSVSSICMVGDNLVNDIAPAQIIGMYTVYARYGDRLPAEYAGDAIPDAIIDSFPGILDILGLSP